MGKQEKNRLNMSMRVFYKKGKQTLLLTIYTPDRPAQTMTEMTIHFTQYPQKSTLSLAELDFLFSKGNKIMADFIRPKLLWQDPCFSDTNKKQ